MNIDTYNANVDAIVRSGIPFRWADEGRTTILFRPKDGPRIDFYPHTGKWRVSVKGAPTEYHMGVDKLLLGLISRNLPLAAEPIKLDQKPETFIGSGWNDALEHVAKMAEAYGLGTPRQVWTTARFIKTYGSFPNFAAAIRAQCR